MKRRPKWLADALLKRTSPVVPWNQATLDQVRGLEARTAQLKKSDARTAARMPALQAEMEAAWDAK